MNNKVISPCISICRTDPVTGYCYGCARTEEEKKIWKDENTNNEWKSKNLETITKRMQGWQLDTFKEYKLADAKQAHEDLESRKLTGPAILIP